MSHWKRFMKYLGGFPSDEVKRLAEEEMKASKANVEQVDPHRAEITPDERRQLLWLMTEFVKTLGSEDIKSRLPGYTHPRILAGSISDHRPDLSFRQWDRKKTPTYIEVVAPEELMALEKGTDIELGNRWTLLASASRMYGAELHFAIPQWSNGDSPTKLRAALNKLEITPNKIWTP